MFCSSAQMNGETEIHLQMGFFLHIPLLYITTSFSI